MRCPVCSSERVRRRAHLDPSTTLECLACGLFFVDPMPRPDEVGDEHYTQVYYGAAEPRPDEDAWDAAAARAADARIRRISTALGRAGRFLDVGAGTGHLLAAAARADWDAQGVEPSARAAEHARSRFGVAVKTGTLDDARFDDASFDAVSLTHVLEHVPDPLALLAEVRRILAPGGVLNVAVPNSRALIYTAHNLAHLVRGRLGKDRFSCGLYPPDHVVAFDPRSLRAAMDLSGFREIALTISGKGDPDHFPVVSWRGAGRFAWAARIVERAGRASGRGSILDLIARR